jgi:hypothetical protein
VQQKSESTTVSGSSLKTTAKNGVSHWNYATVLFVEFQWKAWPSKQNASFRTKMGSTGECDVVNHQNDNNFSFIIVVRSLQNKKH